jgi:hypothetical protein
MATTFECLSCGRESALQQLPAKCPHCSHGNGLLRELPDPVPPSPPQAAPQEPAAG